jgi:hypothetical protein
LEEFREIVDFYKQSLMDDSGESSKDKNVRSEDSKDYAHKVSGGREDSIRNWVAGHSCYILAKL